ncbi:hypothetical protein [Ectobacillus funiculus]|uniref:Uncharacterized protein n=1 Tax=Ectobacillus funiculus TaxID=137993 RepID=A0ABV5WFA3_9BACI
MASGFYKIDKETVREMIEQKLKENPDIFYYVDNYYLEKIIDALVESIAETIVSPYSNNAYKKAALPGTMSVSI